MTSQELIVWLKRQWTKAYYGVLGSRPSRFQDRFHPAAQPKLALVPVVLAGCGQPTLAAFVGLNGALINTMAPFIQGPMLSAISIIPAALIFSGNFEVTNAFALMSALVNAMSFPDIDDLLEFTIQHHLYQLFQYTLVNFYRDDQINKIFTMHLNQRLLKEGDLKLLDILYDNLASRNLPITWRFVNRKCEPTNEWENSPFAIKAFDLAIAKDLKLLICPFSDNVPALVHLVRYRSHDVLMRTVNARTQLEAQTAFGMTGLLEAARLNQINSFMYILFKGADIAHRTRRGDSVLHLAAYSNAFKIIEYCKLAGQAEALNQPRLDGATPLTIALSRRNSAAAISLAALAPPFNSQDQAMWLSLNLIFENNEVEVLRALHPFGLPDAIKIHHQELWEKVMLHGHPAMVEYLLEQGVSSQYLLRGDTLFRASVQGHQRALTLFLNKQGYSTQALPENATLLERVIWLIKSMLPASELERATRLMDVIFTELHTINGQFLPNGFNFEAPEGEFLPLNFQSRVKLTHVTLSYADILAWLQDLSRQAYPSSLDANYLMHQSGTLKSLQQAEAAFTFKLKQQEIEQRIFLVVPNFEEAVNKRSRMLKVFDKYKLYEQCRKLLEQSNSNLDQLVVQSGLSDRKRDKCKKRIISNESLGERIASLLGEWSSVEAAMAEHEEQYEIYYEAARGALDTARHLADLELAELHLCKLKEIVTSYEALHQRLSVELSERFSTIHDKLVDEIRKEQAMMKEQLKYPSSSGTSKVELAWEARLASLEAKLERLRQQQLEQAQHKAEQRKNWLISKRAAPITRKNQPDPQPPPLPSSIVASSTYLRPVRQNTLADTHALGERLDLREELDYLSKTLEYAPGDDKVLNYMKHFALLGNLARAFEYLKKLALTPLMREHFRVLRNTYFHLTDIPTSQHLGQALQAEQQLALELLKHYQQTEYLTASIAESALLNLQVDQQPGMLTSEQCKQLLYKFIEQLAMTQTPEAQCVPLSLFNSAQAFIIGQLSTLAVQLKVEDFGQYTKLTRDYPEIEHFIEQGREYRHGRNYAVCK